MSQRCLSDHFQSSFPPIPCAARFHDGVQAKQKAKPLATLQRELYKQKQVAAECATAMVEMEEGIDFLNDEMDDCASHYYEKKREHDDVAAKLAASEERVEEMEQAVKVSQTELQQMMEKQKVRFYS